MTAGPLFDRICQAPHMFDPGAAARTRETLVAEAPGLSALWGGEGPATALLDGTFGCSPYLARLACREPSFLETALRRAPEEVQADIEADIIAAGRESGDEDTLKVRLRQAKRRCHLAAALADLAGAWPLETVTEALTRTADLSVRAALSVLTRRTEGTPRGPDRVGEADGEAFPPGLFILALGKAGGRELNYSSDIDITVFFD
ncbi:MAG: glutamine-synthetase adenylyltransferase, partial [Caulobacterales bacterium]|nr:glutamine-synthetase adenylyltransferase [Caulobacterales bacterium]